MFISTLLSMYRCVLLFDSNSSPTPRVVWTRLGGPLPSRASMPPDGFGQELVIEGVQLEDAGHYQCSASNSVGTPVTKVVSIVVEC